MRNQLEKAISLSRKTGDRLIVFDSVHSENPFVVMNLDDYEKMVLGQSQVRGLTEEEMLDKINRDIAIWKSDQEPEEIEAPKVEPEFNLSQDSSPEIPKPEIHEEEGPKKTGQWAIRSEIKEGAEEIIEEDRQYLEEITY